MAPPDAAAERSGAAPPAGLVAELGALAELYRAGAIPDPERVRSALENAAEALGRHDERVTELLLANNAEAEARRNAERERETYRIALSVASDRLMVLYEQLRAARGCADVAKPAPTPPKPAKRRLGGRSDVAMSLLPGVGTPTLALVIGWDVAEQVGLEAGARIRVEVGDPGLPGRARIVRVSAPDDGYALEATGNHWGLRALVPAWRGCGRYPQRRALMEWGVAGGAIVIELPQWALPETDDAPEPAPAPAPSPSPAPQRQGPSEPFVGVCARVPDPVAALRRAKGPVL